MNSDPKRNSFQWLIFGGIALAVSCSLILLAVGMGGGLVGKDPLDDPGQNTGGNGGVNVGSKYSLIAIKNDDTVVLLEDDDQEIPIQLEHLRWTNPSWSPNAKVVGVLEDSSRTGTYNLRFYDIATKNWTSATVFSTPGLGISGYAWLDNKTILFTQGQSPDNWLHNYNLESGEIRKLHRVDSTLSLQWVDPKSKRIMFARNDGAEVLANRVYRLQDLEGKLIFEFLGGKIAPQVRILKITPGRTIDEFLITATDGQNRQFYTLNLNEQIYRPISFVENQDLSGEGTDTISVNDETEVETEEGVIPEAPPSPTYKPRLLCNQNARLYFAYDPEIRSGEIVFLTVNPANGSIREIATWVPSTSSAVAEHTSDCSDGTLVVRTDKVTTAMDPTWLEITSEKVTTLEKLNKYLELEFTPED